MRREDVLSFGPAVLLRRARRIKEKLLQAWSSLVKPGQALSKRLGFTDCRSDTPDACQPPAEATSSPAV